MRKKMVHANAIKSLALLAVLGTTCLGTSNQAMAQDAAKPYSKMAPIEQYLMDRTAEIALARSAAPESISGDAEVLVLGRHGFETAVKGKYKNKSKSILAANLNQNAATWKRCTASFCK